MPVNLGAQKYKQTASQMGRSATAGDFLRRWRQALSDAPTVKDPFWKSGHAFWEGAAARAELKRLGELPFVKLEEHPDPDRADIFRSLIEYTTGQICQELKFYRANFNQVRLSIERTKDASDFLEQLTKKVEKQMRLLERNSPQIAKQYSGIAAQMRKARGVLQYQQKQHWHGRRTGVFEDVREYEIPVQERELDTRFQLGLATILRLLLQPHLAPIRDKDGSVSRRKRHVSLRTIARLVVLFFVCADLAEASPGEITLRHNQENVSVESVIRKLRRAGFVHE
jgi:hypothetical protein